MTKKPNWLRIANTKDPNQDAVVEVLKKLHLNTVCREAMCPNSAECFARKTATFMILGTACTRNCRFCNVRHENPQPIDHDEPKRIAQAVKELDMRYVVITSVTRDDLPDGGAGHFADVVRAIQKTSPNTAIEVLIPDFQGNMEALKAVTDCSPNVISHNMETVKMLYPQVRPQAKYQRSLDVLQNIKRLNPAIRSKSGIMLGLGESKEQVHELFDDLRMVGCEILTIGQYLAPSSRHLPIREYIEPERFDEYGETAKEKGFSFVASAPLVRSSYLAGDPELMRLETEEKLARSLTAETTELLPYLPYLLQDFWELGSNPDLIIGLIEEHVNLSESTRILDLACGKGAVSVMVAKKLRVRVKGVDITLPFIEFAAQKAKEFGVDDLCEFVVGNVNDAVRTEKGYDCTFFVSAGNILGNAAETLRKLKATVKPDGYLVIEDAYLPENSNQEDIKCYGEYLTEQQWKDLFKESGLLLVETVCDKLPNEETEMAAITARANELITKYPDKTNIFEGYISSQQVEYNELGNSLICATWLLRVL